VRGPVSFLFSASKLPNIPADSATPEIAFLGRSNVGKSSLLNALLNKKNAKIAHESKHPGRTRTMNLFGVGGAAEGAGVKRVAKKGMSLEMLEKAGAKELKKGTESRNVIGQGGLVVVDCPGYGFGSKEEWGGAVLRYLEKREQLARAFLLVDVTVGLKRSDEQILNILRDADTPHQIVLSKVDKILFPSGKLDMDRLPQRLDKLRSIQDEFRNSNITRYGAAAAMCPDVLCTSSNNHPLGRYKRIGIEELQFAVLDAAGLIGEGKEIDQQEKEQERSEYHGVVGWDQLEKLSPAPRPNNAVAR
jgi:GTP-binding protein